LKLFLSNFIEHEQLDWSNNFSHLSLYHTSTPSLTSFKIDLRAVEWALRKGNQFKYLNKFNDFTNKIQRLYGSNHPFLSDLYELFSRHHKAKGQVEDSISFMRSSILNISAMSGDSNHIIVDKFYEMYQLLMSVGRTK
jgi:hypothetical protein